MSLGQDIAKKIAETVDDNATIPGIFISASIPNQINRFPSFIVGPPKMVFPGIDEAQDHLGEDDWTLTYKANLTVKLDEAMKAQANALAFVEELIDALKGNPSLDGTVQEAQVLSAEPFITTEEGKPDKYIEYHLEIEVLTFKGY